MAKKTKKNEDLVIEAYKTNKEVLQTAVTMRYYNPYFEDKETLVRLDIAMDVAIKSLSKQIPYQLKNKDEETLTGVCKCGTVTAKVDGEFYCKYCGQRVYW